MILKRNGGMDRREFMKKGLPRIFYGLGAVVLAYPVLSFMTFRKRRTKEIVFHPDEQEAVPNIKEGASLIKRGDDIYALSMRCTHLGCLLNYDAVSQEFRCPCHGSLFDRWGKWISGPAGKDLLRAPSELKKNGDVVVTLSI